jgi:hypothetical protein
VGESNAPTAKVISDTRRKSSRYRKTDIPISKTNRERSNQRGDQRGSTRARSVTINYNPSQPRDAQGRFGSGGGGGSAVAGKAQEEIHEVGTGVALGMCIGIALGVAQDTKRCREKNINPRLNWQLPGNPIRKPPLVVAAEICCD